MRHALALLMLTLVARPAAAQIGYLWSFDELKDKSDLVVIARFKATEDTGHHTTNPDLKPAEPEIELSSVFDVLTVLKDSSIGTPRRIVMRHYRLDWDAIRQEIGATGAIVNYGSRVAFTEAGTVYLLFLKRAADGRLEPLSGRVFPDNSVYRLTTLDGAIPRVEMSHR